MHFNHVEIILIITVIAQIDVNTYGRVFHGIGKLCDRCTNHMLYRFDWNSIRAAEIQYFDAIAHIITLL